MSHRPVSKFKSGNAAQWSLDLQKAGPNEPADLRIISKKHGAVFSLKISNDAYDDAYLEVFQLLETLLEESHDEQ